MTVESSGEIHESPIAKPLMLHLISPDTIHVAKTKALISFTVTAKLICAFVFTYADCWFSHVAAHI